MLGLSGVLLVLLATSGALCHPHSPQDGKRGYWPTCPCANPTEGAKLISQLHLQPVCTLVLDDLVKTIKTTKTVAGGAGSTSTFYYSTQTVTPGQTTATATSTTITTLSTVTTTTSYDITGDNTLVTTVTVTPTVTITPAGPLLIGQVPCSGAPGKREIKSLDERGIEARGYGLPFNWFACALSQVRDACEVALGRQPGQATYYTTKTVTQSPTTRVVSLVSTTTLPAGTTSVYTGTTTTTTSVSTDTVVTTFYTATQTVAVSLPAVTVTGPTGAPMYTALRFSAGTAAQCFTVNTLGAYSISAAAAGGGGAVGTVGAAGGGAGLMATVERTLTPGVTYTAIVAGSGGSTGAGAIGAGGGGGGTFLYDSAEGALFALGGGGGGGTEDGDRGVTGTSAALMLQLSTNNPSDSGGMSGGYGYAGGGGAGYGGPAGMKIDSRNGGGGGSMAENWAGGGGNVGGGGGFGGGGGGSENGGGGGGGYAGGNGGAEGGNSVGGAGTSFVNVAGANTWGTTGLNNGAGAFAVFQV